MEDCEVVDAFVAYLRERGHPDLYVDRRPDDENRETSDIDAVAGEFAIEHTSVDTLPNQRRDSDRFMRAVGGIEAELPSKLPYRLNITIEYDAVTKGQNWAAIREALKSWIINDSARLPDGRYILKDIAGIPFRLHVKKQSDRPPAVIFARFDPEDHTLPDRMRRRLDSKLEKLAKYHTSGTTTVLLVESDDYALMDKWKMLDAIRKAYPLGLPPEIDEVWYVDTSIPSEIEFQNFTPDLLSKPGA